VVDAREAIAEGGAFVAAALGGAREEFVPLGEVGAGAVDVDLRIARGEMELRGAGGASGLGGLHWPGWPWWFHWLRVLVLHIFGYFRLSGPPLLASGRGLGREGDDLLGAGFGLRRGGIGYGARRARECDERGDRRGVEQVLGALTAVGIGGHQRFDLGRMRE